jgi:glycosyltransferase involved in cell wall biosynthesis
MATPKTYVVCPDNAAPSGGIRKLYRLVDVLNANGYPAAILHRAKGFRCSWFESQTTVFADADIKLQPTDLVVVPEVLGPELANAGRGVRTIVYNQNAYYTFWHYSVDPFDRVTSYRDPRVSAVLVVSEDNRQYLEYAFPGLKIFRIHYGIDGNLFRPSKEKIKQICYMPRKHPDEAMQVINILKFRGKLDDWSITVLDGRSEKETAEILRQSLVFLSFGYPEGFSLPPLEAMACSCITVGYHGMGGREYFTEEHGFPVPMGDIITFSKTLERVLGMWETQQETLIAKMERAAAYVAKVHTFEHETADILNAWREILGS